MPGKKAHKTRIVRGAGLHGVHQAAYARKSAGEIEGHFLRDRKRHKGQFGTAGNSPLIMK